ncbi:MAG: hypothetical protein Q9219_001639 [cf. Caloplaca sp. 3 TL-2023]
MPSIRYYNQTAPFWDFIASLENNAANHPFFSAYNPEASRDGARGENAAAGPSSPNHNEGSPAPPHPEGGDHPHSHPPHSPHNHPFGPGFPFGPRRGGWGGHGGWGGRRGPGDRCGGGGWGATSSWGGSDLDLNKIVEFFASHFNPSTNTDSPSTSTSYKDKDIDFTPPADVFDAEDHYTIHLSLPGAKKEDLGVTFDADKSELCVAGVVYRPGIVDEEGLKTLALEERGREVGVFERKVRLGSRARPACVDEEGIGARMEDGVLVVRVPKKGDEGFVEVRRVDVE